MDQIWSRWNAGSTLWVKVIGAVVSELTSLSCGRLTIFRSSDSPALLADVIFLLVVGALTQLKAFNCGGALLASVTEDICDSIGLVTEMSVSYICHAHC